jgi:predicted transposase/invertase (TIGR01784 family)
MYTMQAKEGDTYDTLKKCITINIVDYEFLPVNKVHTVYHLTEDETRYRLTDVLEVHFCELEKLRTGMEISDADDPALNWMKFLAARTKGEMEMVAKDDKEIDLVDLRSAEPILRYEIAKDGKLLYEREEGLFERYRLFYIKRFYELRPLIEEELNRISNSIKEVLASDR